MTDLSTRWNKGSEVRPGWAANRWLLPVCWTALSLVVAALDFWLGPFIQFPIAFVIPVALAAWFSGRGWGVALGVLLPLTRLYFVSHWDVPWDIEYSIANAAIRMVVLTGLALLIHRVAEQDRRLEQRLHSLEGLLPICSGCKKIRDDQQQWQPLETYISARSGALFTHGFCPPCAHQYFGEYAGE